MKVKDKPADGPRLPEGLTESGGAVPGGRDLSEFERLALLYLGAICELQETAILQAGNFDGYRGMALRRRLSEIRDRLRSDIINNVSPPTLEFLKGMMP